MDQKKIKEALERLVALKQHKDIHGKDYFYEKEQPLAWANATAALASLKDQGAEPVVELPTHDEAMKWLTDQDIFVSAGSSTATIHSAPTVLLQFAEHVLSTSAAASPQPTPDLARITEAGELEAMADKWLGSRNLEMHDMIREMAAFARHILSSALPVGAEVAPSVPEPRTEQGPTDVDELAKALNSISDAMATWVGDWAADKTLAWIFGVVLGWEDALPEVLKKHRWSEADGQRLQRLHAAVENAKTALAPKDYTKQEVEAMLSVIDKLLQSGHVLKRSDIKAIARKHGLNTDNHG